VLGQPTLPHVQIAGLSLEGSRNVELLGYGAPLSCLWQNKALTVTLPPRLPKTPAITFKMTVSPVSHV